MDRKPLTKHERDVVGRGGRVSRKESARCVAGENHQARSWLTTDCYADETVFRFRFPMMCPRVNRQQEA